MIVETQVHTCRKCVAKKVLEVAQMGIVIHNIIVESAVPTAYLNPEIAIRRKKYNSSQKLIKNGRSCAGFNRLIGSINTR